VLGEGIASVLELCSSVLIRLCSLDALWIFGRTFWFVVCHRGDEGTPDPRDMTRHALVHDAPRVGSQQST
jgi:hypothetical protein